jgi:hypothetical protein
VTRPVSLLAALLTATVLALIPAGANAEDQRPCVSKREFYGARDFVIPLLPGHDRMSKVPPPPAQPIGRLTLEDKWDVRHRGVTVSHTLDGVTVGSNALVRVKMYRSCEEPLSELQVYVGFHKDTNLVLWTMWWPTRQA